MFATHPDGRVRVIAEAQAAEAHSLNDVIAHGGVCDHHKCGGKTCKDPSRRGPMVSYAGRVAKSWRENIGRNVLGGGKGGAY
jgi:hypothetical protein